MLKFSLDLKGTSAYAGPRYQKLYGRVTRVWSNRRGQPKRSAMQEPRPGRSPLVIRFASPSGKYALPRNRSGLARLDFLLTVVRANRYSLPPMRLARARAVVEG